jgi:hypothetical protein
MDVFRQPQKNRFFERVVTDTRALTEMKSENAETPTFITVPVFEMC